MKEIGTFFAAALISVGIFLVGQGTAIQDELPTVGGFGNSTPIASATTTSAVTVTSSTRVLATTTNTLGNGTSYTRVYASICNPSTTVVALNLDQDKPADQPGGAVTAYIAAAAGYDVCYEITDKNAYQGSVTASSTNQTSTILTVKDYVK